MKSISHYIARVVSHSLFTVFESLVFLLTLSPLPYYFIHVLRNGMGCLFLVLRYMGLSIAYVHLQCPKVDGKGKDQSHTVP